MATPKTPQQSPYAVTARDHETGSKVVPVWMKSGSVQQVKLCAPPWRDGVELVQQAVASGDNWGALLKSLPGEIGGAQFLRNVAPICLLQLLATAWDLTAGDADQKNTSDSGDALNIEPSYLNGVRAEIAIITAGFPALEVRGYALPKLRMMYSLVNEQACNAALLTAAAVWDPKSVGEEIKQERARLVPAAQASDIPQTPRSQAEFEAMVRKAGSV